MKISANQEQIGSFKQVIEIFKFLDKKIYRNLLILSVSVIFTAFVELFFLSSLSEFIKYIFENNLENISSGSFYFFIVIKINSYLNSFVLSNCSLFIFITLITLIFRILTLRIYLFQTAVIGSNLEAKCAENVLNVPYEDSKNMNISDVITEFNHIPRFSSAIVQNGILALSAFVVVLSIISYIYIYSNAYFLYSFLILSIIYGLILIFNTKKLNFLSKKIKSNSLIRTSLISYFVNSYRQIILSNNNKKVKQDFFKVVSSLYYQNSSGQFITLYPKYLIEYLSIITFSMIIIAQILTLGNEESIKTTAVFLLAILRVLPSLQIIYSFISGLRKQKFIIESLYSFIKIKKGDYNNYEESRNNNFDNYLNNIFSIKINNLSFKYKNSKKDVFTNYSYEFKKGFVYALKGASGSGKSTLIDLLLNLLQPYSGEVIINNKFKIYSDKQIIYSLRDKTILIGQNDFINGSNLRDFLGLERKYKLSKSLKEKIEFGFKKLNLDNIFNIQDIDKFIGQNGSKLSGGQRQRLLILRSFLLEKEIFIFDEVTSALDKNTQKLALDLLFNHKFKDKKNIVIFSTHSDLVASYCDEIINI